MRIHRIELRDFRGVEHSEVCFDDVGVTIIEGDNEVGKSSLAEAIDLIFEFPDSSSHRRIKAVQPVSRDVGPQVTVEVSTGPYRFTYRKRWHRQKETVLDLRSPTPSQLTGKEAHDRVTAILDETLDASLWKALRLTQGAELTQPGLNVTSLARALDAAAAGDRTADRGDADADAGLWQRITDEHRRYFTPTGQDHKDRKDRATELSNARARLAEVDAKLRALDADVERVAALEAEIRELTHAGHEQQAELASLQARADEVRELTVVAERAAATRDLAAASRDAADAAWSRRRQLIDEVATATAHVGTCRDALGRAAPGRSGALDRQAAARRALAAVRDAHRAAEVAHDQATADERWRRDEFDLDTLTERQGQLQEAEARLLAAEATLATTPIDADAVTALEVASLAVTTAEAEARAGATTVEAVALRDLTVDVDGSPVDLTVAEPHHLTVDGVTELVVADTLRLVVRAGAEATELATRLDAARRLLAEQCAALQVADLREARAAASRQADAQRERADAQAVVASALRDLTPDVMAAKIERLRERIATYAATRAPEPAPPADLEAAKATVHAAEAALARTRAELVEAEREAADADRAVNELAVTDAALTAHLTNAEDALALAEAQLTAARADHPDDDLAAEHTRAEAALATAIGRHAEAAAALAAHDPAASAALLENAEAALTRNADELAARKGDLRECRTRLDVAGEAGLGEAHDAAVTQLDHLTRTHERIEARAAAAHLLYTTYKSRREQAHQRYLDPFRTRIRSFGRLVFGPDFDVTLDNDLQIAQRTLAGVTCTFDQLSVGAQEQLGVLTRLACAAIVAKDDGAPVILDDALGWTDQARLKTMGAAIALAGRESQIIVLTCTPGRYASVGSATVVRLER